MKRRTAREKALQILYSIDNEDYSLKLTKDETLREEEHDPFLLDLLEGVMTNKEEIDNKISQHLEKWSLKRLAGVERTLLRIAAYELFYAKEAPANVIINEAIEVAHKFGDEKSGKFINGVLSKMLKN